MIRHAVAASVIALVVMLPAPASAAEALPRLHADAAKTSVSGLSSGGFMAVQYGVAFSASVIGVGVIAGGPYNCANAAFGVVTACMTGSPSGDEAWRHAQAFEALGQIDPLAGIAKQRIYLFSGKNDKTVLPRVVAATHQFYRDAGVPAAALRSVTTLGSGHAFISPTATQACGQNGPPFIQRCVVGGKAYDQPKQILQQAYGTLAAAAATSLSATVRPFDQREFASAATSLDSAGFVYIPQVCAGTGTGCAVHVVFHGCKQGVESVGSQVFAGVGYNRWADTNRLIVLYPQVVKSAVLPTNPDGCWDWWGQYGIFAYTGPTFMVRSGVQLSAVKAMVDRLTGQ